MPDIFRFHTIRGVEELSKVELDKISLPTHSKNKQSEWYKMLENLCKSKDFQGIITAILAFLKTENAIHSEEQLDKDFKQIFEFVENVGVIKTEKDKKELLKLVDLRKFSDYFKVKEIKFKDDCGDSNSVKTSRYNLELSKVSDTKLCLSILGKLGHKENINYDLLFKVFHLLELLFNKKKEVSLAEIVQLFDKTTALPSCFFKLNPCSKKLEPINIEKPFSHLGVLDFSENENKPQLLKVRGKEIFLDPAIHISGTNTTSYTDIQNANDEKGECDCECDKSCKEQNPCCATIKPFVTDLMVVREELHCYKAKHLAYVETIMLGEERERVHRHLERTEDYSENERTLSKSEEKDHQVSERFSLQTESEKTIESDLSIDAGVTANMWGTGYKVKTSLDVSSQNSKSESQRVAREQAVDITERTVRKIQETVRELTTRKKIVETEETNSHSFKNNTVDSKKHINGMYQFINAEYKGQVMNYGKRLMFEFILPEPLQLYKELSIKKQEPFLINEPEKPSIEIEDITRLNYKDLIERYNLSNVSQPKDEFYFTEFLHESEDFDNGWQWNHSLVVTVPPDYFPLSMKATGRMEWHNSGVSMLIQLLDGNITIYPSSSSASISTSEISITEKQNGALPIRIQYWDVKKFTMKVRVKCKIKESIDDEWQIGIYNQIQEQYLNDLNEYEAKLAKYNSIKDLNSKLGRNPFLNREIERTELKRMAISYISCQFYDQFTAMKRNVKPCGYPQMDLEQAQKDGSFIQFFEQLFDWNLMTYLFYPYFWGQKCDWANKIQEDSGDPLFDKALMAGASRVQVPIKSGHEPLAMHWITFGEIWQGTGQPPVPGSPYYISMAQEIKEQKGVFYSDREGVLKVVNGQDTVDLTDSSFYWNFTTNAIDQLKIDNDIDREIILDCVTYRIVSITQVGSFTDQWTIKLERVFEGQNQSNLKWSTGALFVGAEFLITVPTNLVYLKNKKVDGEYVTEDCLPCFPQPKCE